jgi:FtsH-binding integral membrane protein
MSYQSNAIAHHGYALPAPLRAGVDPYIRQTYTYFFASLAAMAILGVLSYQYAPSTWTSRLAVADGIIWVLCGWFGWRRPLPIVLPLFVGITGLLLGQLAHLYSSVFFSATVLTLCAFGGLSLFVHITGKDFSFLRGFLCVSFFILLGGMLLSFFFQQPLFLLGWSGFGVLVFGCWILYDTSQIIHRVDADMTPGIAAFELILDIVGFHRWLLEHLNFWDILGD